MFHYAKIMSLIYEQKQHLKSTYDSTKTFRYFPNIFIFCVFRWEIITTYLKVVCSSFCFYLQYYGTYILKWRLPTKKDIWIKKSQLIIYEQARNRFGKATNEKNLSLCHVNNWRIVINYISCLITLDIRCNYKCRYGQILAECSYFSRNIWRWYISFKTFIYT